MATYTAVLIPCDETEAAQEKLFSRDGGLAADALRLHADSYFRTQSGGSALTDVGAEIIVVSLPCAENAFVGVSLYCGRDAQASGQAVNVRATSVLNVSGHKNVVYGDAYMGRYLDDERIEWERLDFRLSDLSSDAEWLVKTQSQNKGKSLGGMSTSGTLQNMFNQQQQQMIMQQQKQRSEQEAADASSSKGFESGNTSWSETGEEVEVAIRLRADIKKADVKVFFSARTLKISVCGASLSRAVLGDPSAEQGVDEAALCSQEGLQLSHAVDSSCCTWTLEHGRLLMSLSKKEEEVKWGALSV